MADDEQAHGGKRGERGWWMGERSVWEGSEKGGMRAAKGVKGRGGKGKREAGRG